MCCLGSAASPAVLCLQDKGYLFTLHDRHLIMDEDLSFGLPEATATGRW